MKFIAIFRLIILTALVWVYPYVYKNYANISVGEFDVFSARGGFTEFRIDIKKSMLPLAIQFPTTSKTETLGVGLRSSMVVEMTKDNASVANRHVYLNGIPKSYGKASAGSATLIWDYWLLDDIEPGRYTFRTRTGEMGKPVADKISAQIIGRAYQENKPLLAIGGWLVAITGLALLVERIVNWLLKKQAGSGLWGREGYAEARKFLQSRQTTQRYFLFFGTVISLIGATVLLYVPNLSWPQTPVQIMQETLYLDSAKSNEYTIYVSQEQSPVSFALLALLPNPQIEPKTYYTAGLEILSADNKRLGNIRYGVGYANASLDKSGKLPLHSKTENVFQLETGTYKIGLSAGGGDMKVDAIQLTMLGKSGAKKIPTFHFAVLMLLSGLTTVLTALYFSLRTKQTV